MWEDGATRHHAYPTENVTAYSEIPGQFLNMAQALGMSSQQALAFLDNEVNRQAFIRSANALFWFSGALFLCLIGLIWLSRPTRHGAAPSDSGGAH